MESGRESRNRDAQGRAEKETRPRGALLGKVGEPPRRAPQKTSRRRVAVAEGGRRVVIPRGTLGRQAAAVGGTGLPGSGAPAGPVTRAQGESAQEAAMTARTGGARRGLGRLRGGDDRAKTGDTQESAARVLPAVPGGGGRGRRA